MKKQRVTLVALSSTGGPNFAFLIGPDIKGRLLAVSGDKLFCEMHFRFVAQSRHPNDANFNVVLDN